MSRYSISRFVRVGSRVINLEQITSIKPNSSCVVVYFNGQSFCEITEDEYKHLLKHLDMADEER